MSTITKIKQRYKQVLHEARPPYGTQFKNVMVRLEDLKTLLDKVAELSKDKKRVDFLEKNPTIGFDFSDNEIDQFEMGHWTGSRNDREYEILTYGDTIRETIDKKIYARRK